MEGCGAELLEGFGREVVDEGRPLLLFSVSAYRAVGLPIDKYISVVCSPAF